MTNIEYNAAEAIVNINRTLSKKSEINWEQRRYEIAKEVIGYCQHATPEEMADAAVKIADALINRLKQN